MKNPYDLQNIGIEVPLEMNGSVSILQEIEGAPVVFLFDENHDNQNNCIDKNIEDARELIVKANVLLGGVESHSGGKEWDQYDECYTEDAEYKLASVRTRVSTHPEFADAINETHPNIIYGVDSFGLLSKIQTDYAVKHERTSNTTLPLHEFQMERSKHFIRTLFEIKLDNNIEGNLMLNCGSNHNDHIAELIRSSEIDDIAGVRATYVRVNNF